MYPFHFEETPTLSRTDVPLRDQVPVSAVLFCTGASGFEAMLAGLPVYRLMLDDRIAIDVLPQGISATAVTVDDAADRIAAREAEGALDWDDVLTDADPAFWRALVEGGPATTSGTPEKLSTDDGQCLTA